MCEWICSSLLYVAFQCCFWQVMRSLVTPEWLLHKELVKLLFFFFFKLGYGCCDRIWSSEMKWELWVLRRKTAGAEIPIKRCEYFNSHMQACKLAYCGFSCLFQILKKMTRVCVFTQRVLHLNWVPLFKGLRCFLFPGFFGLNELTIIFLHLWGTCQRSPPLTLLSLSLPRSVFVFLPLRCHFFFFFFVRARPLCPQAIHQTALLVGAGDNPAIASLACV